MNLWLTFAWIEILFCGVLLLTPSIDAWRDTSTDDASSPLSSASPTDRILLESFDLPPTQQHKWTVLNDPVMGGRSSGSFFIDHGIGLFTGQVRNVPFLQVPGFIQARSITATDTPYPDISSCAAVELVVRSSEPEYTGYRFSFGTQHAPHGKRFAYGYKVHFSIPASDAFQAIRLPFDDFTDAWDDATGDPIHSCNRTDVHDSVYCPDAATLRNIQTMSVWGEGVLGKVSIMIQSIAAVDCSARGNDTSPLDDSERERPSGLRSIPTEPVGEPHRFFAYPDWMRRHWTWLQQHVLRVWSQQLSLASTMIVLPFLR